MEATLYKQSVNHDYYVMILAIIITIIFIGYQSIITPLYYFSTSKIELGTVVERNDSITTIVIPDRR